MLQQDIYPSDPNDDQQIEKKIILLFLIDKMDIPLSNSQISQFAMEENFMNYYTVQKYLTEMVEIGYLDKLQDNNSTRYTITGDGLTALDAFIKNVPITIRNRIAKYVSEHRKTVKQDYEITANHFFDYYNNEYIVKCGIYEDEMMLMELNLSVVTKEQALIICNNWKSNVNNLYGQIINTLLKKVQKDTDENSAEPHEAAETHEEDEH